MQAKERILECSHKLTQQIKIIREHEEPGEVVEKQNYGT